MPVCADAASCPKPKVLVLNTNLVDNAISVEQAKALNDAFSIHLRNINPDVEIISNQDIGSLLKAEQQGLLDGAEITAASKVNAEYIVTLKIGKVGSVYVLTSSLIDVDNVIVVSRSTLKVSSVDELPESVQIQAERIGDLELLISSHEQRHPVPPRAPSLQVQVNPKTITPENGKDQCEISVQVVNCQGNAVEGTKVYFEEYTKRGVILGEKGPKEIIRYNDYQYAVTDSSGIATVTYKLDASKGSKAGKDIVPIFILGRGQKKVSTAANIEITGVYLEAFAKDTVIGMEEATDITISLFELDNEARRQPLAGRSLLVQKWHTSSDVQVIPMGPTDDDGNPVTDETGKAYVKFIAGKNEGNQMLRILFQDVGTGYADAVEAWVEINVKNDEYDATVSWKESGDWYYYVTGWYGEELETDYDFTFNSHSSWNKYTGKEKTDASFSYNDYETIIYREGGGSITWTIISNIDGKVSQYPTVNAIFRERFDSFYFPLLDLPVDIPATGDVSLTINDKTDYEYSVDGTIDPLSATAVTHIPISNVPPNPRPVTDDVNAWNNWLGVQELRRLKTADDGRFSYFRDTSIAEKCQLQKTGKDTYGSQWHYEDYVYYQGPPVFFGILAYWEDMEVEGSMSRDVSVKVVKR
jgi:hypothetical protein